MEAHQRQFLLQEFEGLVEDFRTDVDKDGIVGPETEYLILHLDRAIVWLRGGPKPGVEVREFLEEKLAGSDETSGYAEAVYHHDALSAAIEALR